MVRAKRTPMMPARQPSRQYSGSWIGALQTSGGRVKEAWAPKKARPTTSATTADTTTAEKLPSENSSRMTSSAKKAPAKGALKVAEMPAAAPAATRVFI